MLDKKKPDYRTQLVQKAAVGILSLVSPDAREELHENQTGATLHCCRDGVPRAMHAAGAFFPARSSILLLRSSAADRSIIRLDVEGCIVAGVVYAILMLGVVMDPGVVNWGSTCIWPGTMLDAPGDLIRCEARGDRVPTAR